MFLLWLSVTHFPNKPWFLRVCGTSLLKTLWEKKKLLVVSSFFFCHSVFYPFIELSAIFFKFRIVACKFFQFGRVQTLSLGKGLYSISVVIERFSCVFLYLLCEKGSSYMHEKYWPMSVCAIHAG